MVFINEYVDTLINAKRYEIIVNENSELNSLYDKNYIGKICRKSIRDIISNIDTYISKKDKETIERVKNEYNVDLKKEFKEGIEYKGVCKYSDTKSFYIYIYFTTGTDLKESAKNVTKKITKDLNDNNTNKSIQYKLNYCNGICGSIIVEK